MKTEAKLSKLETILDLAKKGGASEAEIIEKKWTDNPINFENNKLKSLETNQTSGIYLRLIKNNKIGISSSTDPLALESIVESAIEASEYGPEATFEFSNQQLAISNQQSAISNVPLEDLVERGTKVIESLKTFHKDLLISGTFDTGHGSTIYLNSNNVSGVRNKTIYSTSFYAQLVRGEDFLGVYEGNSNTENFPDEKEISNIILEKLKWSKENLSIETKKYPVIFTPRAVLSIFISILSVILNGKAIQEKVSPLVNKLGEKLFDEKLVFIENPEIGTQKADFDDEGIKTSKKELIKNGIINSFYFDLSTARRKQSRLFPATGNGFKSSLAAPPSPSLTSIVVEKGNINYKNMIENINEGILVDQLLGASQSNTLAGEFNAGIDLGFKIKNGEIQGRIKNCMLAGNIFDVLKNISEISLEQDWVSGCALVPYMLIDKMTVAGK